MAPARTSLPNGSSTATAAVSDAFLDDLLTAIRAASDGEHDTRLPVRGTVKAKELARAFNGFMDLTTRYNREAARVAKAIGRDGRTTERLDLGEVHGAWAARTQAVNSLIDDLVRPTNEVARVISAVAE